MTTRLFNFNKRWLTGFTQADGSFVVNFDARKQGSLPYYPRPAFVLTQSIREKDTIIQLHKYLGVGKLYYSRNEITIIVRSLAELLNVIIPHFDAYPVRGHKYTAYITFKQVVLSMNSGKHLTASGFLQILDLCYFANYTSQRTLETKQAIVNKVIRSVPRGSIQYEPITISTKNITENSPINPDYLVGLVDGDGSFNFGFKSDRRRIVPNFTIVQGIEDRSVLEDVQSYLGCGKVYDLKSQTVRYQVESVSELVNNVLPVFKENEFNTSKKDYFNNTAEAWCILATEGIKKDCNLIKVVELVYSMNREGKRRKRSKEEYLGLFVAKKYSDPLYLSRT